MKKSSIIGLLSLACGVASSFGQGSIMLDNYNSGPLVIYGSAGIPANGVSGAQGVVGTGLQPGWTLGFYYARGDVRGSIGSDPGGMSDPVTLGGGLILATGSGSAAAFCSIATGFTPGTAIAGTVFSVPGTAVDGNDTITLIAIAYNGSSYANSTFRAHSTAFIMATSANTSVTPHLIGGSMPGFAIMVIPEPSVFALAGLSGTALVLFRRKK